MDVQQRHLKALLFQPVQGVEYGVMLKPGRDDMPVFLFRPGGGQADQCLVVRLASPGGEKDFLRPGIQAGGNGLTRLLQPLRRYLSRRMQAGRIGPALLQTAQQGVFGCFTHFGGGGVVGVDACHNPPPFQSLLGE